MACYFVMLDEQFLSGAIDIFGQRWLSQPPPMKVGSYATTIRVCKWVDADLWLVEMKICQHAMITSLMIFCCIQGSVLSARFRNADHHYAICWSRINNCHLKPCPHCHRKVRLLPKTARQRRNSAT